MLRLFNRKNKKAFSLIELIAAIAIMAVLIALLVPSLLRYVESSRAQKDESSCDEVINAVQLAVSSEAIFDEMYHYSCVNNFLTYSDSSGIYGNQDSDDEYWAPDGCGRAVTITFNPTKGVYSLDKAIVNDMTYGNGSVGDSRTISGTTALNPQCYLKECDNGLLYARLKETIGETLTLNSATYRNSSYTIFIRFDAKDNTKIANVYGMFNGLNLSENSLASTGTGTSTYDENGGAQVSKVAEKTTQSDKKTSALTSSNTGGSGSLTVSYKNESKDDDGSFKITTSLTGVKAKAGNASSLKKDGSEELIFEVEDGFDLPDSITVTGADFTWDKATGKISLSNATADIEIAIKAKEKNDYLNFLAKEDTTIKFQAKGSFSGPVIKYSKDKVTWTEYIFNRGIDLKAGERCYFKGNNSKFSYDSSRYVYFTSTGNVEAYGNIMSLADETLASTTIPYNYYFRKLFAECTTLTKAPSLPATTLKNYCYSGMFSGCTGLTSSPDLPATTVKTGAYESMFSGCTNLVNAGDMAGTTSETGSCSSMFYGCSSLVTAPELRFTTVESQDFDSMFTYCTSLKNVSDFSFSSVASCSCRYMFAFCSSLEKAPKMPNVTRVYQEGMKQMFFYCTALKEASDLTATWLGKWAYMGMYDECTSLTKAPDLYFTTFGAQGSLTQMFGQCSNLKEIKLVNYTGNFDSTYFSGWVAGVASSGTLYYKGTDTSVGDSAIPVGWNTKAERAYGLYLNDKTVHMVYGTDTYAVGDSFGGSTIATVITLDLNSGYSSSPFSGCSDLTTIIVEESFKNAKPTNMARWFYDLRNVNSIVNLKNINTSNVVDMTSLFCNMGRNSTTSFSIDVSDWDVSKVQSFSEAFSYIGSQAPSWSIGDLSNWNVSSAQNMYYMFYTAGAAATSWSIGDLSKWNVSNVTSMHYMFHGSGWATATWTLGDLSNWDVSKVQYFARMFSETGANATTWYVGDIGKWNVSKADNMTAMFSGVMKSDKTAKLDLSSWVTPKITSMPTSFIDGTAKANKQIITPWD